MEGLGLCVCMCTKKNFWNLIPPLIVIHIHPFDYYIEDYNTQSFSIFEDRKREHVCFFCLILPTLFKEKNRYQGQLQQKACFCLITKMCTHCLANVALIMMGSAGLAQTQRHLCVGSPGLHHSYLVFLKGQSWQLMLLGTLLCKAAMAQWQSNSLAIILYAKCKALFQYFISTQIIASHILFCHFKFLPI